MSLAFGDCATVGSALTDSFLRLDLPDLLPTLGLLGPAPEALAAVWRGLRRHPIGPGASAARVLRQAITPLGVKPPIAAEPVRTRQGTEDGGHILATGPGITIRAWATDTDLDPPDRARHSPASAAHRVPESLRLRLTRLAGRPALPQILDAARLHQARVTNDLRAQARGGLECFLQAVIADPGNPGAEAADLWHDGLILIHRLLFILKLEASTDPARGFSFASTRLWRESLSPNRALGPLVRRHLDHGHDTGAMLESGLRALFRACRDGLRCAELTIAPLGGALFGADTMPTLDRLRWGERAVALLLDRLLWTTARAATGTRALRRAGCGGAGQGL